MRAVGLAGICALVVGSLLVSQPSSAGSAATPRIVERTLSCTAGVQAGAHVVYVNVQTGVKNANAFKTLGQAVLSTAGSRIATQPNQYEPQLVAMTAGFPAPPPLTTGGLGYDGKRCRPTKAKVPFTKRGLTGGVANQIGEQIQCFPPGSVLVHFRAVFAASPAVMVKIDKKSRFYSALGRLEIGRIALRAATGKPLAYLDLVDSGTARSFTAGSCS